MLDLLLVAASGYAGLVGVLFLNQRRLLYRPVRQRPPLGVLATLGVREVQFETADGLALFAWYLPAGGNAPVVSYFHGTGGHIGYRAERLVRFAAVGFGALMLEYRGYGGNPGRPTEAGLYEDARAAMAFLAAEGIAAERIALWGESLGSAVATRMAIEHAVAAVVLEAPFTSVAQIAQVHYPYVPARWLVRDRFDAAAIVARVSAPLLMLHGERDTVVPVRYGRALLAAATAPKEAWFAPQAGHQNLAEHGGLDVAIAFIRRKVTDRADPPRQAAAES